MARGIAPGSDPAGNQAGGTGSRASRSDPAGLSLARVHSPACCVWHTRHVCVPTEACRRWAIGVGGLSAEEECKRYPSTVQSLNSPPPGFAILPPTVQGQLGRKDETMCLFIPLSDGLTIGRVRPDRPTSSKESGDEKTRPCVCTYRPRGYSLLVESDLTHDPEGLKCGVRGRTT